MDILMMVIKRTWDIFTNVSIPITYQGTTYEITLLAIFTFTAFTGIAVWLLFSAFE